MKKTQEDKEVKPRAKKSPKTVTKETLARRKKRKKDPEFHEREKEKARERFRKQNTEEYRAKRRAAYAAKHANDPMTEHRKVCIAAAKERMKTPLLERADKKAAELEAKKAEPRKRKGRKPKEVTLDDRIDMLMEQFRLHANGRVRGKTMVMLSDADETYYFKRIRQYDEIGDKLATIDPVKDYATRNTLNYKRSVIRKEFEELLEKKKGFIERMLED